MKWIFLAAALAAASGCALTPRQRAVAIGVGTVVVIGALQSHQSGTQIRIPVTPTREAAR
jgi:hypothetical protein